MNVKSSTTASVISPTPVLWVLVVIAVFGIVYACSLTFVYIDPDDAVSIEYHILGRNEAIQQPFERFQSGMDTLLGLLPSREPVVRVVAMTATSLAAVGFVLLLLQLAFDVVGVRLLWLKGVAALTLLLAAPELLYLGLLYTPMLVGMCCALGAHLLVRNCVRRPDTADRQAPWKDLRVYLAGGLLGLGGVFRWDILAYGGLIALDIVLGIGSDAQHRTASLSRRFRYLLVMGGVAFAVWLALVLATVDLAKAIPEMLSAAKETSGETQVGDIRVFGALAMFFSPAFLIAGVAGIFLMVFRKGPQRWFVVALTLFAAVWPFWSTAKEIIVFVPAFGLLFVQGLVRIWQTDTRTAGRIVMKTLFVTLLLFPWVFGLHMAYGDSAWGPGFELAPMSRPASTGLRNVRVVTGAGAAFPTNEGVRPLYGHAAVLLGGGWRAVAESHSKEIEHALTLAVGESMPILAGMHYDAFVMNSAVRMGFMTGDPEVRGYERRPVVRHLTNASGRKLILLRQPIGAFVRDSVNVLQVLAETGSTGVVCWSEPGGMRRLYLFAPEALRELGPRTAILDLNQLFHAVRARSEN